MIAPFTRLNPVDAKTLQEATTKYDALGRSIASTVWLQLLRLVDVAALPIAGFRGVAGTQGLTTQTLYDSDLTDNVGLETGGGISVTNPLGGSSTVSLRAAIAKLGQPIAQGGTGNQFCGWHSRISRCEHSTGPVRNLVSESGSRYYPENLIYGD